MSQSRLSLALDKGLFELPKGPVGAWNAPAEFDLSHPDFRLSQGFAPVFDGFQAAGYSVSPDPEGAVAASIIYCHRSKDATLDLIARAIELTAKGGLIVVDGAKTDGIDSAVKALKSIAPEVETYSKAHGKAAWISNPGTAPSNWRSAWRQIDGGFETWPGIFSADGIDAGSRLLAETTTSLKGHIADLGAGWGYLAHRALADHPDIQFATLIEADFHAAEAAKRNIKDSQAQVVWGDIHAHLGSYDAILCNPPFHTSRKPDPEIGRRFLTKAATLLKPKGTLWCVANRTLRYEPTLEENFRKVETVAVDAGFKVIQASFPTTTKHPRAASRARVS